MIFVTWKLNRVSYVFFHAEFKYVRLSGTKQAKEMLDFLYHPQFLCDRIF
jgi:hypothetical protein